MEHLTIAGRRIGPGEPPYVVAEIGANHNGDMALCRRLVDAAHEAGADAVKFQSWSATSLVSRAEYARDTRYASGTAPTLEAAVRRYQLTPAGHAEIAAHCAARGVTWFSSAFSRGEVDMLESLGVPAHKVASMDVNHLPLLAHVAATGKPVLLSTGMATLGEVERALATLRDHGAGPVAVLHCVSTYPCPPETANLRTIPAWQQLFDLPVGYSDHTLGVAVPLAAVALGACVLEKHFTLDRGLEGWDHAISADPPELAALVTGARAVHAALGAPQRALSGAELEKRKAFRRRMVAARPLRCGEPLGPDDVEFKRPGTGIRPDELEYVVGRALRRDVDADEELAWSDLA